MQYESSLRVAAETCQTISRDLNLERSKLQQLESRVADLYPSIDLLLHHLAPHGSFLSTGSQQRSVQQLQHDNNCQRELIAHLQSTIQVRERALNELSAALPEVPELPLNRDGLGNLESRSTRSFDDESSVEIITERAQ